jgi:hypothetical protein
LENSVLIDYQGSIKYETIGELIHHFKNQAPEVNMPTGIYKRILLVMIESLENIMKHSEQPAGENNNSLLPTIKISNSEGCYTVECSNTVSSNNISKLTGKIDFINSLDQQGLKEIYKNTITDGVFTKSGGAGLGLIEIAKISGNPIIYEFSPVSEEYVRFFQKIRIDCKKSGT